MTSVIEKDPEFAPARAFRGRSRFVLRDVEGALADLRAAHVPLSADAGVQHDLVAAEFWAGNVEAAAAVVRTAVSNGHDDGTTRLLETLVLRASKGPAWTHKDRYESAHYIVTSDHGHKVCYDTAKLLESMRGRYTTLLGKPPANAPKSRVYVFSSRAGYLDLHRRPADHTPNGRRAST